MLNNKFNVQNILSSHFSPKLRGWFFVGLGGKYHPLPFHSSLISIAPNNEKLSSFIFLIFHPTKLNINLVVMHSDQPYRIWQQVLKTKRKVQKALALFLLLTLFFSSQIPTFCCITIFIFINIVLIIVMVGVFRTKDWSYL